MRRSATGRSGQTMPSGTAKGQVSQIMNRARKISTIEMLERVADGLAIPDHARMRLGLAPTSQRLSTPHGQRYDAASAIPAVEPGRASPVTVAPTDWQDERCEVFQPSPAAPGFAAPRSPMPIVGTVPTVPSTATASISNPRTQTPNRRPTPAYPRLSTERAQRAQGLDRYRANTDQDLERCRRL